MKRRLLLPVAVLLLASATAAPARSATTGEAGAQDLRTEDVHVEGTLPSGATYVMDVPAGWNGTVLLFSHGFRPRGAPNPAQNVTDAATRGLLLTDGYALIGSSYATTGWAVEHAVPDQLATLDAFTERFGAARRTLAWGQSYGGFVTTRIAEHHADRVDGTLSVCGLVHGGVANWNNTLDPVFALKALLAPDAAIPLAGFPDQATAVAAAGALSGIVTEAQNSAAGRARIALAAALHNIPGWNDPSQPRPAPTDWTAQQANQYTAVRGLLATAAFSWRQDTEALAGGNASWNTGVDYTSMLRASSAYEEVKGLYKAAGRSLADDLGTLNRTPRIKADGAAVDWMSRTSAFTGRLTKPQLTLHTTGDALVPVQTESAYLRAATAGGSRHLLRQTYVDNAGHCTFSPAEQLAALDTLEMRVDTGRWGDTGAAALNSRAAQADPTTPARYTAYRPTAYPRPYDLAHPGDAHRP
ncbi:alpha/beta hydrolase family protein [Streptomyces sp. NPDC057621]|uniref:alpha/beta hydrolase family protein n=1 Tax=Streptomyces sp. NPDC057621 TaxID=3346186 RepID=UPI0036BBF8C5